MKVSLASQIALVRLLIERDAVGRIGLPTAQADLLREHLRAVLATLDWLAPKVERIRALFGGDERRAA